MAFRLRVLLRRLGPGLVTGASDDDPSGIATYAQAGTGFSYSVLWTALFSLPLMLAVQEMSARLALVTGRGLAGNMRLRVPRAWITMLVGLLLIANTLNLGADLGMMASSARLLAPHFPFPFLLLLFTLASLALQIFLPYRSYARYLKWLTLSLFAYVAVGIAIHMNLRQAFVATVLPAWRWNRSYLLMLVALFGTTISPYLLFWQSDQEVEEELANGRLPQDDLQKPIRITARALRWMRYDVTAGMIFSNVISWFIMIVAAETLSSIGNATISGADQAARMLIPIAGPFAGIVFALGVIGAGLLTVPILSSTASTALIQLLHLHGRLSQPWRQARGFYGIIILLTLTGVLINFIGVDPIVTLIWAAIANGVIAPPILGTLLWLCNDHRLLGKWTNGRWSNAIGFATIVLMTALPIGWFLTRNL